MIICMTVNADSVQCKGTLLFLFTHTHVLQPRQNWCKLQTQVLRRTKLNYDIRLLPLQLFYSFLKCILIMPLQCFTNAMLRYLYH